MCELQWDALAEIYLTNQENNSEVVCLCSRVFIRNKNIFKQNASLEQSASEDDLQDEEEVAITDNAFQSVQRTTSIKNENEQETVSCYCSASHTDNLSTDEHDSLRDTHEGSVIKGIQQSDSGADLTEYLKQDIEGDWSKFWSLNGEKLIWQSWIEKYSAYINPDYLHYAQDVTYEGEGNLLSGNTNDSNTQSKPEKFLFDETEVQSYNIELLNKELRQNDKPDCSYRRDSDLRNRILLRNLSGSDERLFTEVSEGWNPLSPLSIDCETEAERLLSSRCGSHASSSARTVDSMTNVTRMTISSLDLSDATSSSDSFSSVSSVNSSVPSEESEEDHQNQWNILWKKHYEEEYLQQYNKFIGDRIEAIITETSDKTNITLLKTQSTKTVVPKKDNTQKVVTNQTDFVNVKLSSASKVTATLGQLLSNLTMFSKDKSLVVEDDSSGQEVDVRTRTEFENMISLGLPVSFGSDNFKKPSNNGRKHKSLSEKPNSFESSKGRVQAAFTLMGIEFHEGHHEPMSGRVDYKMKHIRLQNRHLKMRSESVTKSKHIYFDDDGNVLPDTKNIEEANRKSVSSDSSDNKVSSCDEELLVSEVLTFVKCEDKEDEDGSVPKRKRRRKRTPFPPEIRDNERLLKYWHKRFSLFNKFDEGIKLDEESWYSVTPEQVAKHAAERCQCDVIVDAFCGAGGNTIQFALTCKKVIAIDIDPKKIEMARNNAQVYGVEENIEFVVGDFFQLADTLKANAIFLSPPWGGPSYAWAPVYDLEEMLRPAPLSKLMATARKVSPNIAIFLPRNCNTYPLMKEAGRGGHVEIEQNFLNKKLTAVTAYYNDLSRVKCKF